MIIKSVEVKNFRSIIDAKLDCDDITAILGRNGAGKSSFLYALEFFYDIAAPITEEDFFNRDININIEIRVTYSDLRDDEKEEFKIYIQDEKLMVTKRISWDNGKPDQKYYAAALQIPEFADIRSISGKRERINAWNDLVESNKLPNLSTKARSADEIEKYIKSYEESNLELLKPIERVVQFFGARNIGGGRLDKFTKFVLVPAVREATDEVTGKKGAIYQILDMIILRKINSRMDILEFKKEFEEKVKTLYSSENLTELPELGLSISKTLEKFAPGSKLILGWDEIKPPEISLPATKATLIEDNFEGEISRKGHGLQRALILTLLQHLAMIIPEEKSSNELENINSANTKEKSIKFSEGPDLILAIEEPELYLHPSRCRYLAELLFQLVEKPDMGLGAKNQVIYATHSPYFVDLNYFDKIRLVRKVPSTNSYVLQSVVTHYSLNKAKRELAKICGKNPDCFSRESFIAHSISVMNIIVNEGFFADVVVVVEGPSEVGALWKLQEILRKDWSRLGIAIVPAGGKNNIDRPVIIFRGLSIPTYFIFDADSHSKDKDKEKAKECNNRFQILAGVQDIEDFPKTQVNKKWAVFNKNLEKLYQEILGDDRFEVLREEIANQLGYDEPSRVCKNVEGSAKLIELIYNKGDRIPILEEIIEKITQLHGGSKLDSIFS